MKNGLAVVDASPIFSLALLDELSLLNLIFQDVKISNAVWEEVTMDKSSASNEKITQFFFNKTEKVTSKSELTSSLGKGELESMLLYKQLNAEWLLIDDKKARRTAEANEIKCIGTIALLSYAKEKGLIENLRSRFIKFLQGRRYYSIEVLNNILIDKDEMIIEM